MDLDLSVKRIEQAARTIDPVFLNTPQYADEQLNAALEAMQLSVRTLGLLLEPSAAAGLAAIRVHNLQGERLATVLTGSNLRAEHLRGLSANC
jgi:threonine dehydratase